MTSSLSEGRAWGLNVRRLLTRPGAWVVIGALLIPASYVALWFQHRLLDVRTAGDGMCPESSIVPQEPLSRDIGVGYVPPVVTCYLEGDGMYTYWLSASSVLFTIGCLCFTVSLGICAVRLWRFFR